MRTGNVLFMRSVFACTHIADNSGDLFDGRCRGPDAKNALDLVQLIVYCQMAVTGNKDDGVDILQEGWLPIRDKGTSGGGTLVLQFLGIGFLSDLEVLVIVEVRIIDAQLFRYNITRNLTSNKARFYLDKALVRECDVDTDQSQQCLLVALLVIVNGLAILEDLSYGLH